MFSADDWAFSIREIEDLARHGGAKAASAVTLRLNQLEAGQPVDPFPYDYLREGPAPTDPTNPQQSEVDALLAPLQAAVMEAVADELDELSPRVRALIAARAKPKVRG